MKQNVTNFTDIKKAEEEIKKTLEKMRFQKIIVMNPEDAKIVLEEFPEFKNKIKTFEGIEKGKMILIPEENLKI